MMRAEIPPQSTACSPKRSVSVSSWKVVSITPARPAPIAHAYESAISLAIPDASRWTAMRLGVPLPAT